MTYKKSVKDLIIAYDITNKLNHTNSIALNEYLKTGNTECFDKVSGARDLIEKLDFDELTYDVKIALIDNVIGILGSPGPLKDEDKLVEIIIKFAIIKLKNKDDNIHFDSLYDHILKQEDLWTLIIPILKKSEINYRIGKSMIKGSTVNVKFLNLINALEIEKDFLYKNINKKKNTKF